MAPIIKASTSVPFIYRLSITILEPLACMYGAWVSFTNPDHLIRYYFTRGAVANVTPGTETAYSQLGGMWYMFGFYEAILMPAVNDYHIWRIMCAGMIVSDIIWLYAAAQGVGGWSQLATPSHWSLGEGTAILFALWCCTMRILVVLGVGVKGVKGKGE